jgi:hypothetical protein
MKDMQSIYDDAIAMGWWTETPITQYVFGDSHLNIVVFQGPDGMQVQSYERLSIPFTKVNPTSLRSLHTGHWESPSI